jgi:hypothetical protein
MRRKDLQLFSFFENQKLTKKLFYFFFNCWLDSQLVFALKSFKRSVKEDKTHWDILWLFSKYSLANWRTVKSLFCLLWLFDNLSKQILIHWSWISFVKCLRIKFKLFSINLNNSLSVFRRIFRTDVEWIPFGNNSKSNFRINACLGTAPTILTKNCLASVKFSFSCSCWVWRNWQAVENEIDSQIHLRVAKEEIF